MNNFIFEDKTKVYFGKGGVKEYLGSLLGNYGETVMLAYPMSERNSRSRSPFSPTGDFHDRTSKIIMWRVSSIKRSSARML